MMSDLNDFLKNKLSEKTVIEFNADEEKKKWIIAVNCLLNNIKQWINDSVEEGLIQISNKDIEIEEELLGKYKIQSVILKTKWDSIYIEPIGRMIIAAIGRVDIYNAKGNYTLLLTSDRGWLVKIDGKYKIFDENLFTQMIKELMS